MENEVDAYVFFVANVTTSSIRSERQELFHLMNGELFYALSQWPNWMKMILWKKPFSDKDTFVMTLFLYGNGCPLFLIYKWILSSQYWAGDQHQKLLKRKFQIEWILRNVSSKKESWYYFDMHCYKMVYFSGKEKL